MSILRAVNLHKTTETTAAAIAVEHLSCSLGGTEVLKNVSFALTPGSVTSIIGQNGSGKTTLLRCLLRLQQFTGRVQLNALPLECYTRRGLARIAAYVPQHCTVRAPFTVAEFLTMSRYAYSERLFGKAPPTARKAAVPESEILESAIKDTGLTGLAHRSVSSLSGGEQQRVLIASALVQQAEFLLLDEPANHLDPRYQEEIFSLLMRLKNSRHLTILAVHHDLNQAVLTSDRVIALRDGAVVYDGAAGAVMDPVILHSIYEMEFTFVPHPTRPLQMVVPRGY